MLCEKLGKFPGEFESCTEEEMVFLYSAITDIYGEKK
jgi:hypothetical protein